MIFTNFLIKFHAISKSTQILDMKSREEASHAYTLLFIEIFDK